MENYVKTVWKPVKPVQPQLLVYPVQMAIIQNKMIKKMSANNVIIRVTLAQITIPVNSAKVKFIPQKQIAGVDITNIYKMKYVLVVLLFVVLVIQIIMIPWYARNVKTGTF